MAEHAAAAATNGVDQAKLRGFVAGIENCFSELLSERGTYMQRAKAIREHLTEIYDDAKAAGIPKRELKTLIRSRELERKIEDLRNDLEQEQRETLEMLEAALGEYANTPLGQAAIDRHPDNGADARS